MIMNQLKNLEQFKDSEVPIKEEKEAPKSKTKKQEEPKVRSVNDFSVNELIEQLEQRGQKI